MERGPALRPYTKDDLSSAPHSDPDTPLTAEEEAELFAHYNVGYSDRDRPGPHTGVEAADTGLMGTEGVGSHPVEFGAGEAEPTQAPGVPGLPMANLTPRLTRWTPVGTG